MRPRIRRLVATSISAGVFAFGCNLVLGIEEHEPRADVVREDAEAPIPDAAPRDDRCVSDGDCRPPNPCYRGRCDTTLGVCRYGLCEGARACATGVCNPQTLTCEDERDHGFRAGEYALGTLTLGCGKNAPGCVGAVYPFLFVGTRDEVAALRVDDLRATEPRTVPIAGLRVRPGQIVVSGRRLWILGAVQGAEPPYVLPVASIDVPSDPTTREIVATSATIKYPFPSAVGFAAPNGGIFIAFNDAAQGLPAALVPEPLTTETVFGVEGDAPDGGTDPPAPAAPPSHVMYRVPVRTAGLTLAASSGSRLVAYRAPSAISLITGAGTPQVSAQADAALTPPIVPYRVPRFAQGPDGTVLLAAPVNGDPPGDCNCTSQQRLQWVLDSATAATPPGAAFADAERYTNPLTPAGAPCHTCAYFAQPSLPAWLDARSALIAAPASDPPANRRLTAVRLVERDPIATPQTRRMVTLPTDMPTGSFATDRIALSASGGLGFLLVADAEGAQARMSIFDPRCDEK